VKRYTLNNCEYQHDVIALTISLRWLHNHIFTSAPNFINTSIEQLAQKFGVLAMWMSHLHNRRGLTGRLASLLSRCS
jgi:hypothetical protein